MREFRGIVKGVETPKPRWAYGYYFEVEGKSYITPDDAEICDGKGALCAYCEIGLIGFVEVDPATVGQSTGLLDKNGKKVFEDDIVKLEHYGITKVRWLNGEFYLWAEKDMESLSITMARQGKVIGDIHENPLEDK